MEQKISATILLLTQLHWYPPKIPDPPFYTVSKSVLVNKNVNNNTSFNFE